MEGNLHWLRDYLVGCGQDRLHGTRPVFALQNSDKPRVPQDNTSGKWTEIPAWTFLIHLQTVDLAGLSLPDHTLNGCQPLSEQDSTNLGTVWENQTFQSAILPLCALQWFWSSFFATAEARFRSQACPRGFWYRWSATGPSISPSQYIILTINSFVK
jgi:hypothetical protein